jgi:hypothetical protein
VFPIVPNKLPPGQKRDTPVHFLVTARERRELERCAKRSRASSVAEYLRLAHREKAERDGLLKP